MRVFATLGATFVFLFFFLVLWFFGSHMVEGLPAALQIGAALFCALVSFAIARSSYRSTLKRTGQGR